MSDDILSYNELQRIRKFLFNYKPESTEIKSLKVNIKYTDVNYSNNVNLPIIHLPEDCTILDGFINVKTVFKTAGESDYVIPSFGIGTYNDTRKMHNFTVISSSDEILSETGYKSLNNDEWRGSSFDKELEETHLINYNDTDLICNFYIGGHWDTANFANLNDRTFHGMSGTVFGQVSDPSYACLVVGGLGTDGNAMTQTQYLSAGGPWTTGSSLNEARIGPGLVSSFKYDDPGTSADGTLAYVIGGSELFEYNFYSNPRRSVEEWDGDNFIASSIKILTPRAGCGTFWLGNTIVIFGGGSLEGYNIASSSTEIVDLDNYEGIIEQGNVITQNPSADEEVEPGDPIDLIVSKGVASSIGPSMLTPTINMGYTDGPGGGISVGGISLNYQRIPFSQEYVSDEWSVSPPPSTTSYWMTTTGPTASSLTVTEEATTEEFNGDVWVSGPNYPLNTTRGMGIAGTQEIAVSAGGYRPDGVWEGNPYAENITPSITYKHLVGKDVLDDLIQGEMDIYLTITYS